MSLKTYDGDIIVWANEQARLLRAGAFSQLDVEHIAEEIEDVGKSEKRELASRMAILLAHLLKWQHQPQRQGKRWQRTIKEQRNALAICIKKTPSLKAALNDGDWWSGVCSDAVAKASDETGLDDFPESCPWTVQEILDAAWLPASPGV
ncbi:DUF29 domain-containing protein [Thiorhodococcus mannitoliphagus]|uniref:DUF29 domain-containing protein n=1 Tax=Thiorhodococcus mannitoliphagus TaxID=329406 RepID=A0A6P1DW86_9GAMM|nr:DUF29 domain-containing protein [Thiorhodococcus mannitoliphagus]NEX19954.1 DUF29 domain-containing protein [Thiorhodococcus mannitoliphagus]